jgi:putative hydrolase of the HAD superfamily
MKQYRAILFDLFSTVALFQPERLPTFAWKGQTSRSTMGALQATIEAKVIAVPFEQFFHALSEVNQEFAERRARDMREIPSVQRFELTLTRVGYPVSEETHRLARDLSLTHMDLLARAADIPAVHIQFLKRIHAAYPVALVSNFDHGPTARRIVERDGAAPYFQHIVISDGHGWRKPHPKIFTDTLDLLNVEAQDALFVGDSPQDDVVGARGAGLDIAWVNARDVALPEGIPDPDYTIRAIPELEPILF